MLAVQCDSATRRRARPPSSPAFELFLRRAGLGGLPMLLSTLRGDLSFVGPELATPRMSGRHLAGAAIAAEPASGPVRPGLTGWADIRWDGARSRGTILGQKIGDDLFCSDDCSLLLDLRIPVRALDAAAYGDHLA